MGGRNLATYPRCPKCGRKRDVSGSFNVGNNWTCYPCGIAFRVRNGLSVDDEGNSRPADIKAVDYCHKHYREYIAAKGCPRCSPVRP